MIGLARKMDFHELMTEDVQDHDYPNTNNFIIPF